MRNHIATIPAIILFLISLTSPGYGITFSLGGSWYVIAPPTKPEGTLERLEVEAVNPPPEGLFVGEVLQYRATAIFSDKSRFDVTEQVTWYSSNQSIASISNQSPIKGQVTGIAAGQTFITAVDPSTGTSSTQVALVIQEQVKLERLDVEADSPPPEGLFVGQVLQYRATAILSDESRFDVTELVTWYSSNQSIASISNQSPTKGQVTGIAAGQTFIAAVDPSTGTSSTQVALVIQEQQVITCNSIAEIHSNGSCLGRTVTLQGYLTERLDSDNYIFYDGTGSEKIEYEGDIPLYRPIEITGRVDGTEIEVSSYRFL